MNEENNKPAFTFENVQDVQINLVIDGKTYLFLPKLGEDKEELKKMRLALVAQILDSHVIYSVSIEDQISKL